MEESCSEMVASQGTVEGGFMGRTNKLVDGCYSFWQGGLFPLLQRLTPELLRQTGNPCPLLPGDLGPMVVPSPPSGHPVSPQRQAENAARIAQVYHILSALCRTSDRFEWILRAIAYPVKRSRIDSGGFIECKEGRERGAPILEMY